MIIVVKKIGESYYAINPRNEHCIATGVNKDTVLSRAADWTDTIIVDSSFREEKKE